MTDGPDWESLARTRNASERERGWVSGANEARRRETSSWARDERPAMDLSSSDRRSSVGVGRVLDDAGRGGLTAAAGLD